MSPLVPRLSFNSLLDVTASLTMISVSVGLAWVYLIKPAPSADVRKSLEVPKELVSIAGAPLIGASSSRLVVLEFSDFECPFCGKFAREVWPAVNAEFVAPGRVQFAFRNLPITAIHTKAQAAAQYSVCAGQQKQFWSLHDSLFKQPLSLDDASLDAKARDLRLDATSLSACLAADAEGLVQLDVSAAGTLRVKSTPSFFFGVRVDQERFRVLSTLSGFQSLPAFKKILKDTEAEINAANCGLLTRFFGICKAA